MNDAMKTTEAMVLAAAKAAGRKAYPMQDRHLWGHIGIEDPETRVRVALVTVYESGCFDVQNFVGCTVMKETPALAALRAA